MKKICVMIIMLILAINFVTIEISSADLSQDLEIPLEIFGPDWDINHDGIVDVMDVTLLTSEYGNYTGIPHWIREDITGDGDISIKDISILVNHYGDIWLAIT